MKSFFNLFLFSIIITAISSCSLTKNLAPNDGEKLDVVTVPCVDKQGISRNYYKAFGTSEGLDINETMDDAKTKALAALIQMIETEVSKDMKSLSVKSTDKTMDSKKMYWGERQIKAFGEHLSKVMVGVDYSECSKLMSKGNVYTYFVIAKIPSTYHFIFMILILHLLLMIFQ